jgi:hypothetical protein
MGGSMRVHDDAIAAIATAPAPPGSRWCA